MVMKIEKSHFGLVLIDILSTGSLDIAANRVGKAMGCPTWGAKYE